MEVTQPTISSFFKHTPSKKKRSFSPIDLTADDENPEHAQKRFKTSQYSPTSPFQQWSFTLPSQESSPDNRSPEEVQLRTEERKAIRNKFLPVGVPSSPNRIDLREEEEEEEGDQHEFVSANKAAAITARIKKRKVQEIGPSGQPYTPLEMQVLQLKKENRGTILMIEVGYRYIFYGDDAKVASKELGMVAYTDRNFLAASIPIDRRDIHLKKLLSQGYRVGIVGQVETAALKKTGKNKNAPFERRLLRLCTSATFVDSLRSSDDLERFTPPLLLCLVEEKIKNRGQNDVRFGVVTVCPSTGDVVWDDFEDNPMRTELEARLAHSMPAEFLLPSDLTQSTKTLLSHFTCSSTSGRHVRIEKLDGTMPYDDAFNYVSEFYVSKRHLTNASESVKSGQLLATAVDFPKLVIVALAHIITYLSAFGISDALLETKFFDKFSSKVHMFLAANTLSNLEVYRNETDFTVKGSLLWVLDNTKTKFGSRMLKYWIGRPLTDRPALQERITAVEEVLESADPKLHILRNVLRDLPDLAKGLCRFQYGQCTPEELAVLLPALSKVANAFSPVAAFKDVGFKSKILNTVIFSLPRIKEAITEMLDAISREKASEGDKENLWTDPERYPAINNMQFAISHVEAELDDELKKARKILRLPSLQWSTVTNDEYLIELDRRKQVPIPDAWVCHSKTKTKERYRTPEVIQKLEERARYQETLQAEANNAYQSFLQEMSRKHYSRLREGVVQLAIADCIISLAQVALRNNYVRPQFTDNDVLEIVDGRHPMIEALRHDPFVPNSIKIGDGKPRSKIITGPNMGGKSSCVRMIALIAIMAQVGSYVPATSVKMRLLDSILTRMGASDDLAKGRSTFMVEMLETRDILRVATTDSLVILDELGRGTSTFDGMAIADAVLHQLTEKTRCKTLFITHYPLVASGLERRFPHDVENLHMDFEALTRIDGTREVAFLYRLVEGLMSESFGIECGRLAGLPESVLCAASNRASNMQAEVKQRMKGNRLRKLGTLLNLCLTTNAPTKATLEELKYHLEMLRLSEDDRIGY